VISWLRSWAAAGGEWLITLARPMRQAIALSLDLVLCLIATWLAYYLRQGDWALFTGPVLFVAGLAMFIWMLLALRLSIYQSVIRFSGGRTLMSLAIGCLLLGVILSAILVPLRLPGVPRTMALILPLVLFSLLALSRTMARHLLVDVLHMARAETPPHRILIYGAGMAGTQLAAALRNEAGIDVAGFVDDDERLDLRQIDGVTVWKSQRLSDVLARQQVDEVLLAIPSATRARRRAIIDRLQAASVKVRSLPSVANILDGRVAVSDLRTVEVEELLGRDPVAPNDLLMGRTIVGKRVLVTGAGGSIGSELCRQIIGCRPAQLILVEQSEYALYAIEGELRAALSRDGITCAIEVELGNVADRDTVDRLFRRWRPETVYHAAAYKHVPLVEANPVAGVRNNVFATLNCCLAAEAAGVATMILISTDKAVRPTNVMGASKRVSELILQARAQLGGSTNFAMVRFGNVLGSSGSVVPLFKGQIAAGGPVTLTDFRITRFFMTIPEAAQLVIQAGGMAKGGDVFVLDMGQPVRIVDLAKAMIRLSGLTVRDAERPDGDIELVEVGLRDGEKLYEELLIGDNPQPTEHERIMRAQEAMVPWPELGAKLDELSAATATGDVATIMAVLHHLVPEFRHEKHTPALAERSVA
jgi:FlaA1/EpsC-like NDP-sugar epimerase